MSETKLTENRCAHLFEKKTLDQPLKQMFQLQSALQKRIGMDFDKLSFKQRVDFLSTNWASMSSEFGELLERLPWKHWKKYSNEQLEGWTSESQKMETLYEVVDMFHFMLNFCLVLGIDDEMLVSLYVTKNQENLDRQARGY
jgi:dimeric dUTPase (all-alpha-NTP-PPase superfamily)